MTATTLHLAQPTLRAVPAVPAPTTPAESPAQAGPPRTAHDWIADATCAGEDPALFDPVNRYAAARATAVCATCPVRRACLLDALVEEQDTAYGPWLVRGGMTPKERRDLGRSDRATLLDDLRDSPALVR